MRSEIYDTFEQKSVPQFDKPERIGFDEVKEAVGFIAGLTKEIVKATLEVAEKDGLKRAIKELKYIGDLRLNLFKY